MSVLKSIFTKKSSWSVWEMGGLKACLISLGILIGSTWPTILTPYAPIFWAIFIVFAIWGLIVYFRQVGR